VVHFNGLDSIIESIYLEDRLGSRIGDCNVFVNPENIKYLVGKLVIINSLSYPPEHIQELVDNGNKVVSRIKTGIEGVLLQPYIIRVSEGIVYNGRTVKGRLSGDEILQDYCSFPDSTLYFPKLDPSCYDVMDKSGNLSAIGWALHQVGVRIREGLNFPHLDLIKLGKVVNI
jgi:hypothetical protein